MAGLLAEAAAAVRGAAEVRRGPEATPEGQGLVAWKRGGELGLGVVKVGTCWDCFRCLGWLLLQLSRVMAVEWVSPNDPSSSFLQKGAILIEIGSISAQHGASVALFSATRMPESDKTRAMNVHCSYMALLVFSFGHFGLVSFVIFCLIWSSGFPGACRCPPCRWAAPSQRRWRPRRSWCCRTAGCGKPLS